MPTEAQKRRRRRRGGDGQGGHDGHGGGGGHGHHEPERGAPPGHGEIRLDAPDFTLYARLNEAFPTPTTPGGWAVVARPIEVGITEYAGQEPRRESVGLMFDEYQRNVGVEDALERLESLLEPVEPEKKDRRRHGQGDRGDKRKGDKGDGKGKPEPDKPRKRARPPVFTVRGGIHLAGRRVVLETLEWGESIRRPQDDKRIRQSVTIGLLEFEKPDRLKIKRKKKKTYVTKQGDTLKSIAKKQLGRNASPTEIRKYAEKLGRLNKIRDINRRLKKGRKLQLA